MTKRLLIASPKGGAGKTNLARNLAVTAALDSVSLATEDFDAQRTLTSWYGRRAGGLDWPHYAITPDDVADLLAEAKPDLLIIDTSPSIVEHGEAALKQLIVVADLVLIPCRTTIDDEESAAPLMRMVRSYSRPAAFVLNALKPRANIAATMTRLSAVGPICPATIADRLDYGRAAESGLGLAEIGKHPGADEIAAVWAWIKAELWGRS
jgi:chromosome partitioning protein